MGKVAKTKYNVDKGDLSKRTYDGTVFASVLEMKYYRDVVCPGLESGQIIKCERQVPYELQPKFTHDGKSVHPIVYVADFVVTYEDGSTVVIDTKGCADSSAILKRKMFWYVYPNINYIWISFSLKDGGWINYDELKRLRSERKRAKKRAEEAACENNQEKKGE